MKKYYSYILPAVAVALASCADSYDGSLKIDKPESVASAEQLASLNALNSYVDKANNPNFKLGLGVNAADYAAEGLTYSIALSNFDCVMDPSAWAYSSIISEDGSFALSAISDMILENAPQVVSGAMLSYNALPKAYLENVISANFIKGDLESGVFSAADFDSDAIDAAYAMTNGSSATVVADPAGGEGNVLRVGAPDDKAKNSYPEMKVKLPDGLTLAGCKSVTFDIYCVDNNSAKKNLVMIVNGHRKNFTGDTPDKRGCALEQWSRKLITLDFADVTSLTDADLAANEFTLAIGPNVLNTYYYIDNVNIAWQTGEADKYVEKTDAEKAQALADNFGLWAKTVMAVSAPSVTDYVVVANPMSDMDTYMLRSAANEMECGNDTTGCFFFNDFMGDNYLRTVTDSLSRHYTAAGGQGSPVFYVKESGLLGNAAKTQRLLDQVAAWSAAGAKIDGIAVELPLAFSADAAAQAINERNIDNLLQALAGSGKLVRIDNLSMTNVDAAFYAYIVSKYCSLVPANQRAGIIFGSTADLWRNNSRTDVYEAIANAL